MNQSDAYFEVTRFRSRKFARWLYLMEKNDFIQSTETKVLTLKPTFKFDLPQNIIKILMSKYHPSTEIGGILFAEPIFINKQRVLRVRKVKFLRNISDDPQCKYLGENRIQVMHEALMGTKGGIHFFPIAFHAHTQPQDKNDPYYILNKFIMFETSEADKKNASLALSYESIGISILLPRALVFMNDNELFIGFYGGRTAPLDFKEYMMKLTGKTIAELNSMAMEWAKDEEKWWKKALIGAVTFLASLGLVMASSYPPTLYAVALEILRQRQPTEPQTFFALSKGEEMKILIP